MISSNAAYQISDCIFPFALQATDPKSMRRVCEDVLWRRIKQLLTFFHLFG